MRTTFKTNAEVCHVWAQQTQSTGRAGNIFFHASKIFSYGPHYTAAMIHTFSKGKRGKPPIRFALVNSHRYSVTTAQHPGHIRNALHGLMPFFESPDVYNPKTAVTYLDGVAKLGITSAMRRMKVTSADSIRWELEQIEKDYKNANELRAILGMAALKPKACDLAKVNAHLEKRLARYRELNTPEMIEARRVEAEKRKARKDAAAPELLEALKTIRAVVNSEAWHNQDERIRAWDAMDRAIAKAEGNHQ